MFLLKLCPPQGVEEEEEAEQYSDEEAPAAASEPHPPTTDGPVEGAQGEEEEGGEAEEEEETGGRSKEESKAEEKGNLAGERQSGDGQVRQEQEVSRPCATVSLCSGRRVTRARGGIKDGTCCHLIGLI